jgi:hypothetical protein
MLVVAEYFCVFAFFSYAEGKDFRCVVKQDQLNYAVEAKGPPLDQHVLDQRVDMFLTNEFMALDLLIQFNAILLLV